MTNRHTIRSLVLALSTAFTVSQAPTAQEATSWLEVAEKQEALSRQRPDDGLVWQRWGEALLELGAPEEAVEVLRRSDEEFFPTPGLRATPRFGLARAHAALGRREEALSWLEKATRSGFSDLAALERDAALAKLAGEPRFDRIRDELRRLAGPHVDPSIPITLEVPVSPGPFRANGKTVLAYEVHVFSFWPRAMTIVGFEVLEDSESARRVAFWEGAALEGLLERPGDSGPKVQAKTKLTGNRTLIAFPWIELDPEVPVPPRLRHRLWLKGTTFWNAPSQPIVEGGAVSPGPPAVVIGPPLKSGPWVARSSGNTSYHHRNLQVVLGGRAHPQSFAVDWARHEDVVWNTEDSDPPDNSGWATFGQDVLAVADGEIVSASDGTPDNALDDTPFVVPFGTSFGNHVVLDLGQDRYATYAHLMNGSLRVKTGDVVRRGEVMARVGASGDSFGAHLHFHVSTGRSPYVGDGLPYGIDSFAVVGQEDPKRAQKGELAVVELERKDVRRGEMPVDAALVSF